MFLHLDGDPPSGVPPPLAGTLLLGTLAALVVVVSPAEVLVFVAELPLPILSLAPPI